MSNKKLVLIVVLMIFGVTLGVREGGKSFFREMVGSGPFPTREEMEQAAKQRKANGSPEVHQEPGRSQAELDELKASADQLRLSREEQMISTIAARAETRAAAVRASEDGEAPPQESFEE